jgi:transposase-like protein
MTQEEKKPEKRTRRQYSVEEGIKLLDAADAPGESISTIARKHGVSPSVMFRWRQLRESGGMTSLKADEGVGAGLGDAGGPDEDPGAAAAPRQEDRGG